MFKYRLIILFVFAIKIASSQDLTATQNIPATVTPGTDFTVEISINRGTVTGFMKFFQEIPQGCTATDIDSKSGSFTFSDNGAKIVWISPPTETTYTVSYKVSVPQGVSGTKTFGGKISYISNNERKAFDLETKTVIIGNSIPVTKTETPTNPVTASEKTTTTPAIVVKENTNTTLPATTTEKKVAVTQPTTTPIVTKKETTEPTTKSTTIPVSSKVPTTAVPSSVGKTYRVQIGAYASKPKIDGIKEISTFVLENGITKYFSGNFNTYEDAVIRKKEMIEKGFQGAFIVAFENGKIVK
jgi:hypothetical protein